MSKPVLDVAVAEGKPKEIDVPQLARSLGMEYAVMQRIAACGQLGDHLGAQGELEYLVGVLTVEIESLTASRKRIETLLEDKGEMIDPAVINDLEGRVRAISVAIASCTKQLSEITKARAAVSRKRGGGGASWIPGQQVMGAQVNVNIGNAQPQTIEVQSCQTPPTTDSTENT